MQMEIKYIIWIEGKQIKEYINQEWETHQGVFDISFLSSIPNIYLAQGKDSVEVQNLLYTAFKSGKPFFIRYPRKSIKFNEIIKFSEIKLGKWKNEVNNDSRACVISYGDNVSKIKEYIKKNNLNLSLINAIFIKPINKTMLSSISKKYKYVFVVSDDVRQGGLED